MPFLALSVQAVKGQGRRKGARTGKMVEEKNCVITLPLPVRVDKPFTITKKLCETKKQTNKQTLMNQYKRPKLLEYLEILLNIQKCSGL